MWLVGVVGSIALIASILWDGFEAIVFPRRVTRSYRFARFFYRSLWSLWRWFGLRIPPGKRRETFLSVFGPGSLILLFAAWVVGLTVGFAALHWSLGTPLMPAGPALPFGTYLYFSGATFFTFGFGDLLPVTGLARSLVIVQAGLGFGFLAIVIGYLPVLYQAFSRQEATIGLLDARAGSPPCAGQMLLRAARAGRMDAIEPLLGLWERWASELLESHLSFPVLSYYRSQHDNQSWLAALAAILDTCSLVIAGVEGADPYQAQLTFAMSRHALVDLALIFRIPPEPPSRDRLPPGRLEQLRRELSVAGLAPGDGAILDRRLNELRALYEPFLTGLSRQFLFALPDVFPETSRPDNWQTSAWTRRTPGIGALLPRDQSGEHFG